MAILTVVFFRTALLLLPLTWSTVLALGGALSTQVWSTASRTLWSHTWLILLIGIASYILLSQEKRRSFRGWPMVLATLLSWAYFVRPTASLPVVAIDCYMLIFRRRELIPFAITGASWMLAFAIYSLTVTGHILPNYYRFDLTTRHLWVALVTNLLSPSRGLFIYVPSALFVLWLVAYYWGTLPHRQLAVVSLSIIIVHLFTISTDPSWWGGHCYGPRLCTDIVPWFFLLAVLTMRCLVDEDRPRLKQFAVSLGLLTLIAGAFMNGRGAMSHATDNWVNVPIDVDQDPHRVWDWTEAQFLAGLHNE